MRIVLIYSLRDLTGLAEPVSPSMPQLAMSSQHVTDDSRLFKYNPNSAEQLAAIEGAVKAIAAKAIQLHKCFRHF